MSQIVGAEITGYRPMTSEELAAEGWETHRGHTTPTLVVLDSGVKLYPSQDSEGNAPGSWIGGTEELVGETVTALRAVEEETLSQLGLTARPVGTNVPRLIIGDEYELIPLRDPEGNGPGEVFGVDGDETFFLSV